MADTNSANWARWPLHRKDPDKLGRGHVVTAVGKGELPDGTTVPVAVLACGRVRLIELMVPVPERPDPFCEVCAAFDKMRRAPRLADDLPAPKAEPVLTVAMIVEQAPVPVEAVHACFCGAAGCDRGGVKELRLAKLAEARQAFEAYLTERTPR